MKTTKVLVRPTDPSVGDPDDLSPLDQYMIRIIIPIMCAFKIERDDQRSTIVENLKAGLARTINEMPFIASVIVPDDEERGTMKLHFDEEATGVWFHEQECLEYSFDEMEKRRFSFSCFPVTTFVPEPRGHSEKCPVVTVLATFIKGGLVVTYNGHHGIMDAQSLGTFASIWSRNVLAVSEGYTIPLGEQYKAEDLDRTGFHTAFSQRLLHNFHTYQPGKETNLTAERNEILRLSSSGDHLKLHELVPISHWFMTQEKVDLLNQSVRDAFPNEPGVTEAALFSALIWKSVAQARNLAQRGIEECALFTSTNVRRMVDPQLSLMYPGNAIALARADATTQDLYSNDELKALYNLARKTSDSIDEWTADELYDLMGLVQESDNVVNLMLPNLDHSFYISQPARFGNLLGKSQWGSEMGAIKAFRFAFPPPVNGFACPLPALGGGMDLMIWINEEVQAKLKTLESWTKWVEPVM
jgi:trichothecene 3-O-acetyltransferase